MQGPYREILGPSLRGPSVKDEGWVFHGTARAIRLINSLLFGENENIPNIHREFPDNFPKNYFFTKLVQNHFPRFSVDIQIFWTLSGNWPRISRKIIVDEFHQKYFREFYNFPKFSENFETILPDDQPIKLRESRAGWVAINKFLD